MKNIITMNEAASNSINPANATPANHASLANSANPANEVTAANNRSHVTCFNCGYEVPADPSKTLLENCKEFIQCAGPFFLKIDIYIKENVNFDSSFYFSNLLLYNLDNRMLGEINQYYRDKLKEDVRYYLEGFAFFYIDRQKSGSKVVHVTILLKDEDYFDDHSCKEISGILDEVASSIYMGTEQLIMDATIDVIRVRDYHDDIESCYYWEDKVTCKIISFSGGELGGGLIIAEQQVDRGFR